MKYINFAIREIKNTFEFFLIPLLVVLFPNQIYFSLFKFICKHTPFYNKYSLNSYAKAKNYIDINIEEKNWVTHVKLLYLTDIADYWMARFRPKKMLKLLNKNGKWHTDYGHMALSLHWGPGYITLLDLKKNNLHPCFVHTDLPVDFKYQSFVERFYRKIRTKHINKVSGSTAISTGGGYKKIISKVNDGDVPILLFDAPQFNKQTLYQLKIFDKKYNIAQGFVKLICNENINYQLYSVKLNYTNGTREMSINQLNKTHSSNELLSELSRFFEELLLSSPEQWFFWRQSNLLLLDQSNER